MSAQRDEFKRECRTNGPGGWRCACCGPRAGAARTERRAARRRLAAATRREVRAAAAEAAAAPSPVSTRQSTRDDNGAASAARPVRIFYNDAMVPATSGRGDYSKSPSKPRRFMEHLATTEMWRHCDVQADFAPVTPAQLQTAHEAHYVNAYLRGAQPSASSSALTWTPTQRDSVLLTNGALLAATRVALTSPGVVAFAPVSGFHHATPDRGGGFCTFSGQVIAALDVYRANGARGAWIDLDGHFGNSIEDSRDFAPDLDEAIPRGCNVNPTGTHGTYLRNLERGLAHVEALLMQGELEYICFAHGADSHEWDQLGCQCTTDEWVLAASLVYSMVARVRAYRPVPLVLALFGGYRDDDPASVLALHAADLAVCLRKLYGIRVSYEVKVAAPAPPSLYRRR